jgi:iron complex outermembrane receptor protein
MKKKTKAFCSGSLSPCRTLVKKMLLFVAVLLLGAGAQAQQKVHVTGIVNDDKGNPAVNASVTVRGAKTGTTTDASGAFAIDVPSSKSVIVISNTGFESQELAVGTKKLFRNRFCNSRCG